MQHMVLTVLKIHKYINKIYIELKKLPPDDE
jgi:hypothetical protein